MSSDVRGFAGSVGRVGLELARAAATWRARQWALLLAIAATTLLAYVEKASLQSLFETGDSRGARALALFLDVAGSGLAVTLTGLAALLVGRWTRHRTLVDTALVLAAAGLWCWIFTKTGQLVLAERRPYEGGAMKLFASGGHGVSGHAAAAALLFWPVRDVLARDAPPWVRHAVTAALLAWAALVGWSRVWLGMHFVWNVELGLAIGFFTGFVATRTLRS